MKKTTLLSTALIVGFTFGIAITSIGSQALAEPHEGIKEMHKEHAKEKHEDRKEHVKEKHQKHKKMQKEKHQSGKY